MNSTPTLHPIQVVSRRTGLSPDVIRAWERRYGAVTPARSSTSRRLYSETDVERLVLLRRATLAGRRIGDVAHLDEEALISLIDGDLSAQAAAPAPSDESVKPSPSPHLVACTEALERLDAADLETCLGRAALQLGVVDLIEQVLSPLMKTVGERWRDGTLRICHEHLATSLVRSALGTLRTSHHRNAVAPELVVGTPSGQIHEIGALMAAVAAAAKGWKVNYLGSDIPAEEIAAAARVRSARAVALSMIYPEDDPRLLTELRRLTDLMPTGIAVLAGGPAAHANLASLNEIGISCLYGLADLEARLDHLRAAFQGASAVGKQP